jgi:hypothetical protein
MSFGPSIRNCRSDVRCGKFFEKQKFKKKSAIERNFSILFKQKKTHFYGCSKRATDASIHLFAFSFVLKLNDQT